MTGNPPDLTGLIDVRDNALVLSLRGSMSLDESTALDNIVKSVLEHRPRFLLIDMAGVKYLTSLGIRALIKLYKFTKDQSGCTCLVAPSRYVDEVLGLSDLRRVLPSYPTLDAACAALPEVSARK